MENAEVILFGDKAVDISIVNELKNKGVNAIHYKDSVLNNIQRGAEDPEVIAYSDLMGFVILTRDIAKPAFECVTKGDINGKSVQEDFSNNKVLIRNRYFRDCDLELQEITNNVKYRVVDGSGGHNGILKYVPTDLQDSNDIDKLSKEVADELNKPNINSSIKTIRV